MIGGGGERKTLRLVAQYADATNVFGGPDMLRHKYAVLRERCDEVGRPFDEIERTTLQMARLDLSGADGSLTPEAFVDHLGRLADVGVQHAILGIPARDVEASDRPRRLARHPRGAAPLTAAGSGGAAADGRRGHPAADADVPIPRGSMRRMIDWMNDAEDRSAAR